MEYALRYPQHLSQLVLMDTCGDTRWVQENAPELLAKRGYSDSAVQTARRFFNGQLEPREVFPAMMRFGSAYYYHPSIFDLPHSIRSGRKVKLRADAQIFGFRELLKGWTVMERLREIQTPTLVLAGRDDFQFPPEHQAILAEKIPHARLEIIERAGQNAPMEHSAHVCELVKHFIRERNGNERA